MRRLRAVRQVEVAECALAALVTVARLHGHDIDLAWARRRFPPQSRRPDLASLLFMAQELGLAARALRAEPEDLRWIRAPAILHWEFRHFVVLTRARRRSLDIWDPAAGHRRLRREASRAGFTGVVVEFARAPDFRPLTDGRRLRLADLLAAFRGLKPYLGVMLALLLATQALGLALPVGSQLLIDEAMGNQDRAWLHAVVAGLGCVMSAALILDLLRQRYGLFAGIRMSVDTAAAMVRHVLALPIAVLERRTIADTLSRVDSLQPIQHVLVDTLLAVVVQAVTLVATLALMVFYSPLLAGFSVLAMLAAVLVQLVLMPRARAHDLDGVVALAEARQSLIDSLAGAASVHAFGLQSFRLVHWRNAFERAGNARANLGRLSIAAAGAQGIVGLADQLLFLAVGIAGIGSKSITLGVLFAFLTLRGRLAAALAGLVTAGRELYLAGNHLERVGELLAEPAEKPPARTAYREMPSGRLACAGLTYAWHAGRPVLSDFTCSIDAGERVVICGPSGAGKTTLLKLLACELEPAAGSLQFDGWDAALWDRGWLRRHFGVVRQSDRLFSGSIGENIAAFSPCPEPARIRRAAELADLWQDLLGLPLRLETPLTDGGSGLSGGQLQRLMLARALYPEPRVLFLDEATSQLDERTECRVLGNLARLGITIVSIAHGPQAIRLGGRPIYLRGQANGKTPAALP